MGETLILAPAAVHRQQQGLAIESSEPIRPKAIAELSQRGFSAFPRKELGLAGRLLSPPIKILANMLVQTCWARGHLAQPCFEERIGSCSFALVLGDDDL